MLVNTHDIDYFCVSGLPTVAHNLFTRITWLSLCLRWAGTSLWPWGRPCSAGPAATRPPHSEKFPPTSNPIQVWSCSSPTTTSRRPPSSISCSASVVNPRTLCAELLRSLCCAQLKFSILKTIFSKYHVFYDNDRKIMCFVFPCQGGQHKQEQWLKGKQTCYVWDCI